ncbi:MAG: lysophospholipid acyltransferase family protein, partial [Acidimicrobiales bacterium]
AQSSMGLPPWAHTAVYAGIDPFVAHWGLWNLAATLVQAVIGIALLTNRAPRAAITVSVTWAGMIWWVGEGFGFLPSGQALVLGGAPGAALAYAVLAGLAWPRPGRRDMTPAAWKATWATLWLGGAALQMLGSWSPARVLEANLSEHSNGQPGFLASTAHFAYRLTEGHPLLVPVALALVQAAVGLGGLTARHRPQPWIYLGMATAGLFWVVGEQMGSVFSGGTDLGLGPLVILLACAGLPGPLSRPTRRLEPDTLITDVRRLGVITGTLLATPLILAAGVIRPQWGRQVTRHCVLILGPMLGVRIRIEEHQGPADGRGHVVVANHSSPLDIPAMVVAFPRARMIMAADILPGWLAPVIRRCLGVIPIDRNNPATAHQVLADLAGETDGDIVIFPEGAIAPVGQRLGFKSGPFVLAIQSGRAVLPVAIHGASASLAPRAQLRLRPGLVTVEVLDPIPVSGLGLGERKALREATRRAILDALGPEDGGRGLPRGPDVPPCPQTHADLVGPPTQDRNVVSVSYIQAAPGAE